LPRVLDAIGFARGVLLGHSDGASIAAIYAGSVQDHRVRGLALLAPEALGYIRVPMLIVQGDQDQYGTLRQLEVAKDECYCPVETVVLPGIRHIPQREAPEATLAAVSDFINRLLHDHREGRAKADSGVAVS
jgi:pimeloyl-ACP methyl ester carboxylesterase